MKIIAVVPAYNEKATIAKVVRELKSKVDRVVVIDDGSGDETYNLARQAGASTLKHFLNRGQGAALQTGIDYALNLGADIIVTFDADGQHHAEDIKSLIQPIIAGKAEVVLGSRFIKNQNLGMSLLKKVTLKLATIFDRWRTGLKISDTHNGFRAFSRRAAEIIKINQDGMAHASEILEQIANYHLKYIEAPVKISYTNYSKKKGQSVFNSFKIVRDLILGKISK